MTSSECGHKPLLVVIEHGSKLATSNNRIGIMSPPWQSPDGSCRVRIVLQTRRVTANVFCNLECLRNGGSLRGCFCVLLGPLTKCLVSEAELRHIAELGMSMNKLDQIADELVMSCITSNYTKRYFLFATS